METAFGLAQATVLLGGGLLGLLASVLVGFRYAREFLGG